MERELEADESKYIKIEVETGGFMTICHWGMLLHISPAHEKPLLSVYKYDFHQQNTIRFEGTVEKAIADKMWELVFQQKIFSLSCTNYLKDSSDDAYHLGVSVSLKNGKDKWQHLVPTGVFVRVSNISPSRDEMQRLLTFILQSTSVGEKTSALELPHHIKLRWESRLNNILLYSMLTSSGVIDQSILS
eukprot:TRINITY_DN5407_c0_g1_i1.p1 TRINITY_DN5407_c0_g1~~TRINITY_DN5407_c0_g1_i1.p1  ORF type:complete len:189 (-),score=44.39 TRINITY_DN5407_c0_g1_i1:166-732(-)